ncbi:MAG: DUF1848 domain-containing protein [Tannerellaceae bacterium]|nr:DUF1848 domain-containing protein [Tannerellaceae bacterium]
MAQPWEGKIIRTDQGEMKTGIAPLILSASRATDIPAFHTPWLMNRLEKGYIKWENRFNPAAPVYISLDKVRLIVFWTKDPRPLIYQLDKLEKRKIHSYFQYTLNHYEEEGFEPGLPALSERIKTFKKLSSAIGKEKVIWRFDPLLLTQHLTVDLLTERIRELGDELIHYTDKLVVSFADILTYRHVAGNMIRNSSCFTKENIHQAEFTEEEKHITAQKLRELVTGWKQLNPNFEIGTCAEEIALEAYGIRHNKCIDDELLIRLFPDDKELMDYIGYHPGLFQQEDTRTPQEKSKLKDKNQRRLCGCIFSKDIGAYNTCGHACIYCYANTSRKTVEKNRKRIDSSTDSLLPPPPSL